MERYGGNMNSICTFKLVVKDLDEISFLLLRWIHSLDSFCDVRVDIFEQLSNPIASESQLGHFRDCLVKLGFLNFFCNVFKTTFSLHLIFLVFQNLGTFLSELKSLR